MELLEFSISVAISQKGPLKPRVHKNNCASDLQNTRSSTRNHQMDQLSLCCQQMLNVLLSIVSIILGL